MSKVISMILATTFVGALAGTAAADKVAGTTGTGAKYSVGLTRLATGGGSNSQGGTFYKMETSVTYADTNHHFAGAQTALGTVRITPSTASVKPVNVPVLLKLQQNGTYSGAAHMTITQTSGLPQTISASKVWFQNPKGGNYDSNYGADYQGPTNNN
jgi:hypothetical protein